MSESEPTSTSTSIRASAEPAGAVAHVVSVEVPVARVRRAFDDAYRELAKRVSVKGFRPGKAPRSVLERLYGPAIAEDVEGRLVSETFPEAVEQVGVAPVAEPTIDAKPLSADGGFSYTARVEVKPKIELPKLGGLKGHRPKVSVADAEIDREVEALRLRRAPLVDEPAATPLGEGHFATLDYVGRIEGQPFPGGSAQGATVMIGAGSFPAGFEEGILGMQVGDDREVNVTLPDDPGFGDVAGKAASFAVHLVALKRRDLPEADDAFARDAGGFATLAELRERIRADLTGMKERESRAALRKSLMDGVLGRVEFPLPPALVERRLSARIDMAHRELESAMPHEELHRRLDAWKEEWRAGVERELREELVLEAIGSERSLAPDDDAVSARMDEIAREQGVDARRLRKSYEERGMRPALALALLRERALDAVIADAEIEEIAEA